MGVVFRVARFIYLLSNILILFLGPGWGLTLGFAKIANYFFPNWSIDFLTLTDISTLATMLYIAYPTALVLISIALWVVMIGIIKLTGRCNFAILRDN